ncbi:MOSC domain-containing protein [Nocardioides aurantiacus]|uniref:MOSC domain-containing protein n=1 Tax=Nocardioides aurantiacus TaxID=86796 RepID=UPI00403F09B3
MRVTKLRRYPVKAMAGEALDTAEVDDRGLVGDRWYAVVDEDGRFASGKAGRRFRRRDEVLAHAASTTADGVRVSGPGGTWPVGDPALDVSLSELMGAPVRVLAEAGAPHQDAAAVSLVGTATLDWCREHLGVDGEVRRLRANLLVATDEPFVEEGWEGAEVEVGGVVLRVLERTVRCRMVDAAQDGLTEQPGFLTALGRERDASLGVYAEVRTPGTIRVGDPVSVR